MLCMLSGIRIRIRITKMMTMMMMMMMIMITMMMTIHCCYSTGRRRRANVRVLAMRLYRP
jgi:hypothetical protein